LIIRQNVRHDINFKNTRNNLWTSLNINYVIDTFRFVNNNYSKQKQGYKVLLHFTFILDIV